MNLRYTKHQGNKLGEARALITGSIVHRKKAFPNSYGTRDLTIRREDMISDRKRSKTRFDQLEWMCVNADTGKSPKIIAPSSTTE